MKTFVCRICGETYIGPGIPPTCPFCGAAPKYFALGHVWTDANAGVEPTAPEREHLLKAVELERSNTEFYRLVSETCTTPEIAKMFRALMKQEREHAELFIKLAKPEPLPTVTETAADDVPAILAESLKREQRATAFYGQALAAATTPRIREVLEAIMNVEKTHIELDTATGERHKAVKVN